MVETTTTAVATESRLVAERGPSWQRRASKRARYEAGQSRRDELPLEGHADLSPERGRRDPLEVLGEADGTRLPELSSARLSTAACSPSVMATLRYVLRFAGTQDVLRSSMLAIPRGRL
jgi:hypothetical protein